ncbi:gliding motility-associated-like protein [Pontibacter mucosus]|uniref:Gliding motility-associated-like protein n=1 Tax=Pontibacter mucosus TaxID=1649266 RepID=A0A2T5YS98_9BACT|nr:gliding motility-associated C-terminal domain-containing protein [Pontibacter mucosus]PTX22202.1 gliding motility-associated-like protein [Pontibacter mucosus]
MKTNLLARIILLLALTFTSNKGYAQLITNPSFESTPTGQNYIPSSWTKCHYYSTPDTQPGGWNVTTPPSHGSSYLGLVTRGNQGPYANTTEDAQIQLSSKLKAGKKYNFSIDLAYSVTQGHPGDNYDFISYANPTVLRIWGGVNDCQKTELLWESPTVDHTNWQTYDFSFTPKLDEINFLILEAYYAGPQTYFGNILIDNIIEKKTEEPSGCVLETFNVFTPNADGYNDVFYFKSATKIARFNLQIFNRWGKLVFETDDIDYGWDGKYKGNECAAGVYYWSVNYMCIVDESIVDYKRKGTVTIFR